MMLQEAQLSLQVVIEMDIKKIREAEEKLKQDGQLEQYSSMC